MGLLGVRCRVCGSDMEYSVFRFSCCCSLLRVILVLLRRVVWCIGCCKFVSVFVKVGLSFVVVVVGNLCLWVWWLFVCNSSVLSCLVC